MNIVTASLAAIIPHVVGMYELRDAAIVLCFLNIPISLATIVCCYSPRDQHPSHNQVIVISSDEAGALAALVFFLF